MQEEDAILYSDDANLLLEQEKQEQTIIRLQNYAEATKSRQLKIQWGKVKLLTRKTKQSQQQTFPHPYNEIQDSKTGMVLGKQIHIQGHQKQAIQHRLTKAKQTWNTTRKKLFQNQYIPGKIRVQLWNALIRSTLTYALQTQELATTQENKINSFAQVCLSKITNST